METTTTLFSTSPTHLIVVAARHDGIDSDFLGVYLHHVSTHSHTMQCLHNAAITPRCPFYSRSKSDVVAHRLVPSPSFTTSLGVIRAQIKARKAREESTAPGGANRAAALRAKAQSNRHVGAFCLLAVCVCMCVLSRVAAHTHTLSPSHTLSRSHMRAICPHRRPC
jgi:hypothetical protein